MPKRSRRRPAKPILVGSSPTVTSKNLSPARLPVPPLRRGDRIALPDFSVQFPYIACRGAVPKWPKGMVCKTIIRRFESDSRLHIRRVYFASV